MSGAFAQRELLDISKCIDPRMDFAQKRDYMVMTGISDNLSTVLVSQDNNMSNVSFIINAPQLGSVLDRKILIKWYVQLVFTGTNTGPNNLLSIGVNDALRANPMSAACSSIYANLNGVQFSTLLGDYVQPMSRYFSKDIQDSYSSTSPSMPDQFGTYADYSLLGLNRNPLALFGDNASQCPRGSYTYEVVANTSTSATVKVSFAEWFRLSPFLFDQEADEAGLVGVQNLRIQQQIGCIQRIWSHAYDPDINISSITASFYQNPEIHYTFLQPNQASVPYDVSKSYIYPYTNILAFPFTSASTYTRGSGSTRTASNITMSSIPERIYLFMPETKTNLTNPASAWVYSDAFASISNVNITFGAKAGILGPASQEQLYEFSLKNGLQMSYPAFKTYSGSVIALELGKDIPLDNLLAPGTSGNFSMQVTVTFNNPQISTNPTPNVNAMNYDLYVVTMTAGTLVARGANYSQYEGLLSVADVVASMAEVDHSSKYMRQDIIYGHGFASSAGDFFKSVYNRVIKPAADVGKSALSAAAHAALPAAKDLVGDLGKKVLDAGLSAAKKSAGRKLKRALKRDDDGEDMGLSSLGMGSGGRLDGAGLLSWLGLGMDQGKRKKKRHGGAVSGGRMPKNNRELRRLLADVSDDE